MKMPIVFKQFILLLIVVIFIYPALSSIFKSELCENCFIVNPGEKDKDPSKNNPFGTSRF